MATPIKILSTDFDGTLHAEHEDPPVPEKLQRLIAELQGRGMTWVINTGRDLSSLMESLGRARLPIWPDYVVTVEREIHVRDNHHYVGLAGWNERCTAAHVELFARVRDDVPRLIEWVNARFDATLYEDAFSPFCLIARNNGDADEILRHVETYCASVPGLTVVRNDVYARFSHAAYNKGTALGEIARRLEIGRESIAVAGDHLNDLPMLSSDCAAWLIAPGNAIPAVKRHVLDQNGFVATEVCGHGVAQGIERILASHPVAAPDRPAS
jgi:hypothetical protein